jgi:hypothetical protein
MCGVSLGFAAQNPSFHARVFWAVSAGYFEAVALGLCAPDIYAKRAASRILLQYRTLARGEPDVSERLVQDLLFFCSQSALLATQDAPALTAVQHAYGFVDPVRVDYEKLAISAALILLCWRKPASGLQRLPKPGQPCLAVIPAGSRRRRTSSAWWPTPSSSSIPTAMSWRAL